MRRDAKEDYDHRTEPTARKVHVCCECEGAILRGQRYVRRNGHEKGFYWNHATCTDCESLYKRVCAALPLEKQPVIGKLVCALLDVGRVDWINEFNATGKRRTDPHYSETAPNESS